MASMKIERRIIPADRPHGVAVDLVGTGTSWTGSTAFTLSGVSPLPTILKKIVNSATSARLVITTGAVVSDQTLSVSDGTNSATTTVGPYAKPRWFPGLDRR